ncbi:MAG TPA: NHL repeat-containing protein [Candidatus Eisenbacteria bacterium]|nr:NHL repeat-containing protein [Candidatus Eisenbacteria bacterium]
MRKVLVMCLALAAFVAPAAALDLPPMFSFHIDNTNRVSQMAQLPSGQIAGPAFELGVVRLYSESGVYQTSFGSFNGPSGIAVDADGYIYVCEQLNNRVQKLTPGGVFLLTMGTLGSGPGQLHHPTNCAFSPDESILYVTELTNHRVSMFDKTGAFLGSFGTPGSGPGQLQNPFGIAVDQATGDVFVANQANHRVDRFTSSGTWLSSFGQFGSGINDFNLVVGLDMDGDGNLWMTDQLNDRIKKTAQDGTVLTYWGTFGNGPNEFYNPWSVFVTQQGSIWVGDTYNYRIGVYRYTPTPTVSSTWGGVKTRYR